MIRVLLINTLYLIRIDGLVGRSINFGFSDFQKIFLDWALGLAVFTKI